MLAPNGWKVLFVKGRIFPEHRVQQKDYTVICIVDEEKEVQRVEYFEYQKVKIFKKQ